jgi:hypothetical protein
VLLARYVSISFNGSKFNAALMSYCQVYKGLYKGKNVAVKVLKELKDGGEIEDFKKELEIMTSIRDPHMVSF